MKLGAETYFLIMKVLRIHGCTMPLAVTSCRRSGVILLSTSMHSHDNATSAAQLRTYKQAKKFCLKYEKRKKERKKEQEKGTRNTFINDDDETFLAANCQDTKRCQHIYEPVTHLQNGHIHLTQPALNQPFEELLKFSC